MIEGQSTRSGDRPTTKRWRDTWSLSTWIWVWILLALVIFPTVMLSVTLGIGWLHELLGGIAAIVLLLLAGFCFTPILKSDEHWKFWGIYALLPATAGVMFAWPKGIAFAGTVLGFFVASLVYGIVMRRLMQ